jgi:hypothetical protein
MNANCDTAERRTPAIPANRRRYTGVIAKILSSTWDTHLHLPAREQIKWLRGSSVLAMD